MQKVRFWQNLGNIILTAKIDGALIPFSQTLLEFRIKHSTDRDMLSIN